ncbi:MAG: hypothetical protein QOC97_1004 [Chloroflexota bacterium]|nr:hypothetical protein [Chloroflexota bacterium]
MIPGRVRSGARSAGGLIAMALLTASLIIGVPGTVLAQTGQIKLFLLPVDQRGSFFDLSLAPGDHRTLAIEIGNDGAAGLSVRTYAADVYTIVNGGFGGRLRNEPATGATRWVSYPTSVLTLAAGQRTRRSFTVDVPAGTAPGEYIASLVLENDRPIPGEGTVALDQIVRQAVAIVVTVPGERLPALSIGGASHQVVAGNSVVAVAVENGGNVRLAPVATFSLLDAAGRQVSNATVPMGTFYARTSTSIEVPLAALLTPGTYTVRLTLVDAGQDVRAEAEMPLVITGPTTSPAAEGITPGLADVVQGGGIGGTGLPLQIALAVGLLLAAMLLGLAFVARRRSRGRPATGQD